MVEVLLLLQCLTPYLESTTWRRLTVIVPAMLAMTGRVTMLGLSRWTGQGGSYRTIQRFFTTNIAWCQLHWACFYHWFVEGDADADVHLVVGDETVVTKSGRTTFGLDRFFSSIFGKPVPGVSFFALSLVSVKKRRAFPLLIQQLFRSHTEEDDGTAPSEKTRTSSGKAVTPEPTAKKKTRTKGRPKGRRNTNKAEIALSPYLCKIQDMVTRLLQRVGDRLTLTHLVLDGAFGHNAALQMARRCNLHLVSKLHANSALYFPYAGAYSGRGPRKKYGKKLNDGNPPQQSLKTRTTERGIQTDVYQMPMRHKLFPQTLNVVLLVKTNLTTHKCAHVILFSSDLTLSYETLIDYYRLRFHIEFNFRDAKQYWGLEDFMNVNEQPLTNAVNMAFFMVNVSYALRQTCRHIREDYSVEDLKAHFRGLKYVEETLKLLPEKPAPILIQHISEEIAKIGSIHAA